MRRRTRRGVPAASRAVRRPDRASPLAGLVVGRWSASGSSRADLEVLGDGAARGLIAAEGTIAVDGPTLFLWGLILLFAIGGVLLFAERQLEGGVSAFAGQAAALPGSEAERTRVDVRASTTPRSTRC